MCLFISKAIYIPLIVIIAVIMIFLLLLLICFFKTFYSPSRKKENNIEYPLLNDDIYKPYHDVLISYLKQVNKMEYIDVYIKSFDGLILHGRFYRYSDDAPIELVFHGYRGSARRDLSGGVSRCFKLKHSILAVDNRASGYSQGHVISFGINESKDCLLWIDFILKNINKDAKIILGGISMGGAIVTMVGNKNLPSNVVGIVADCGYTSPKKIIEKVIKDMHLPVKIFYPLIKLSAKIFGNFDLEENSSIDSLKTCKVPVLFIHGTADSFVPYEMSVENYNACASKKKLVSFKDAGHGLCYMVDSNKYLKEIEGFFKI